MIQAPSLCFIGAMDAGTFGFDSAAVVLLSTTDYAVSRASKVPRYVIESSAIYRQHVNGKVLFVRPEIMGHPDATDKTATRRTAQLAARRLNEATANNR